MSIRAIRRDLGISLQEASSAAGVHLSTWRNWEITRVPDDMISTVARILGVKPELVRPDLAALFTGEK